MTITQAMNDHIVYPTMGPGPLELCPVLEALRREHPGVPDAELEHDESCRACQGSGECEPQTVVAYWCSGCGEQHKAIEGFSGTSCGGLRLVEAGAQVAD